MVTVPLLLLHTHTHTRARVHAGPSLFFVFAQFSNQLLPGHFLSPQDPSVSPEGEVPFNPMTLPFHTKEARLFQSKSDRCSGTPVRLQLLERNTFVATRAAANHL